MQRDNPRDPNERTPLTDLRAEYCNLVERLERNQQKLIQLARSAYRMQEEERRRLARELHDGIGQNLTALKHHLALLQQTLEPDQHEAHRRAAAALALATQTLEDTRQLTRLLRPQILDDLGLEAALRWLVRTLAEPAGLKTVLDLGSLPEIEGELATLLFRVAQEALTNVVRHAGAQHAVIRLSQRDGMLRLEITDDGRGWEPTRSNGSLGSGLSGMKERVKMHGGRLAVDAAPGQGCRLRVTVPLEATPTRVAQSP